MKISIRDVAARAGVSTGTVSNVLNAKPTVQPHIVDRVRKAASELGFEPDQAAAQLRGRPARMVAALVPDLYNPYFTTLLAALEQRVRESGYGLIVSSANENPREERERLTALLAWRPAGLVIVPCTDEFRGRNLVTQRRVPFVVMDRIPVSFRGDAVTVDNVDAGRLSAEHVADLGHKRVVVAASTLRLRNIRERCEGVRQVFETRGLHAPRIFEVGTDFDQAVDALTSLMAERERPTALLALTAFATLGILTSLQRRGLRIPQDISVVGFDDYSWMQAVSPPLTSIRQPVEAMGREAWERLRTRIDGSDAAPTRVSLLCERIERASTSPPSSAHFEGTGEVCFESPQLARKSRSPLRWRGTN